MGLFHPFGYARILILVYQKRESKAAQNAFGHAFPGALCGAHLQQFSYERHFLLAQFKGRAEFSAHLDLGGIDIAVAGLEALDLIDQNLVLLAALVHIHFPGSDDVLQLCLPVLRRLDL